MVFEIEFNVGRILGFTVVLRNVGLDQLGVGEGNGCAAEQIADVVKMLNDVGKMLQSLSLICISLLDHGKLGHVYISDILKLKSVL